MPSKLSKNKVIKIIKNSSLENGALVSINSNIFGEKKNKDLHFVFLSEAALACMVAKKFNLNKEVDGFFNWLNTRLEDSSVLYKNYSINGSIKERTEDKNAAALLIIASCFTRNSLDKKIIKSINQESPFYALAKKCLEDEDPTFLKKILILRGLKKTLKRQPLKVADKDTLLAAILPHLAN